MIIPSDQIRSVAKLCPTCCDPMNSSTPGLPIYHQHPEFTETPVHRISDAIEPSHPLSSPSPPAPNPSQHQSLFQCVNSSHEVAKVLVSASASVLPKNTQDWSPLGWIGWISLQSKGLGRVFSSTTVQIHDHKCNMVTWIGSYWTEQKRDSFKKKKKKPWWISNKDLNLDNSNVIVMTNIQW